MADHRREDGRGALAPILLIMVVVVGTLIGLKVLPDGPEPDLFIIGDSVTYLSEDEIQDRFRATPLEFVAIPGFSSEMLLPDVLRAMGSPGDPAHARQRVAALVGYNDVRLRDVDSTSMHTMVELTSKFQCGVWLALPARPGGADNANAMAESTFVDQFNLHLQAQVERYGNLHLSQAWAQAVNNAPLGKLLKKDGVHPNAAGRALLAQIYRDAISEHCPRQPE
ncbi:MAG: hypothetical protein JWO77_2783 [Ilumatobacteraceae bacterium]|nr:hypothetical protein [Ilumatobacteraceae bacterium]